MLSRVIRLVPDIEDLVVRAARAAADRLSAQLRSLWSEHLDKVINNAAYAAATPAVLSGLLGLPPIREVIATVVAAILGVYLKHTHGRGTSMTRWDVP